jgi:hypothetical protein
MGEQDVRRAKNEAAFRTLNEQIQHLSDEASGTTTELDLVCECASATCMKVVGVLRAEYETVRRVPAWLIVASGHEETDTEMVVMRGDSFNVVEKHGEAAAVAEQTNPRSHPFPRLT